MTDPAIRTAGLTKYYGRQAGIVDLDLEVLPGEVFGFLGPNGAGKTTTIRLLLDFIRPTRGSAAVLGRDSRRGSLSIRADVGYLPGELRLYASLSGRELISFFGHLRGSLPWPRALELAERLECDLGREIRTLSTGNRQKLGLVQAFMGDPQLLILDEPTNGLDPLVQQTFYALVDEARRAGRTVFLSSHILPEVERVCDRVAIVRDNRLVEVAGVSDLRRRALRRLEVTFADPTAPALVGARASGLDGVRDVVVDGSLLRCTVVGPMDALLKAVTEFEVVALTSGEPTLEEVFLAYYGGGGR